MKSESEVREEIKKLEAIAADLWSGGSTPYPIMGALSALKWVIGEVSLNGMACREQPVAEVRGDLRSRDTCFLTLNNRI